MRMILLLVLVSGALWGKIGTIAAVQGEAVIVRASQTLDAVNGTAVEEKDRIKTAAKTKVQVMLNDQTVVTIGPNSEYVFNAYNDKNDPHVAMELKRGFFKAVTGKLGKIAPKRFQIRTKSATIGIRGTYLIAYIDEEVERIGCIKGTITVTFEGETLVIPAGSMALFVNGVWEVTELDMKYFEPLTTVMTKGRAADQQEFYLPGLDERVIVQEQLVEERTPAPQDLGPFIDGVAKNLDTIGK